MVRLTDRESGPSARTIARRPSLVSGLYAYLVARGDTPVQVIPMPRDLSTRRQGGSRRSRDRAAGAVPRTVPRTLSPQEADRLLDETSRLESGSDRLRTYDTGHARALALMRRGNFTDAYAPYYIAVLGGPSVAVKGPADLAGKSVAVNRGTLEDTSLTAVAPPSTDIQRFNDYNGVISAFLAQQVQLIVVSNDVGASILARNPAVKPEQKFELMSSPDHIALNKNEPRLKALINGVIQQMRGDGSLNKISIEWLKTPLPANF